jgi:endonuclease/exonuclease/phosphatase family metal-dependent hydrolase
MTLVTYNLRSGGAARTHWSKVLDELRPDIFLVQETVAPEEHLSTVVHRRLRRRVAWSLADGRRWGSAVYVSRGKARPVDLPDFRGHVVGLEIVGAKRPVRGRGPLRAFSIHAPIRGSYQRAMNLILDMIADYAGDGDIVIGGDFNLSVSERHVLELRTTSQADRAIQGRLRDEFGLANCWQVANPACPLAQTLRWANDPVTPYHCDGLFVPQTWLTRLRGCEVISEPEWNALSDHNPVVARFETSA